MPNKKFTYKEDDTIKLKGTPEVPFNKSKKLSSIDGSNVLYYIDVLTANQLDLDVFCDFTHKYPHADNYVLIDIPIKRV